MSFSLGGVTVQVWNQADAEGVGVVQALDDTEVTCRLRQTFAETQATVIHGQRVSIKVTCVRKNESCWAIWSDNGYSLWQETLQFSLGVAESETEMMLDKQLRLKGTLHV